MEDKYQRKIEYARISLLNTCNLKCKYCYSENIVASMLEKNDVFKILDGLEKLQFRKVRFTGGEPLLHPNIIEILEYSKDKFEDIGITTNGILLDKYLDELKELNIKRINISIDSLDKDEFNTLTQNNNFNTLIDNIIKAKQLGFIVKLNVVLIKSYKSNIIKFLEFGKQNEIEVRFIELMTLGTNSSFVSENYISSEDIINELNVEKLPKRNNDVASYYMYNNYVFGVISPISDHFCDKCNRIRITSDYRLRLCLHAKNDYNIKGNLENFDQFILEHIGDKQEKHMLNENENIERSMLEIGG